MEQQLNKDTYYKIINNNFKSNQKLNDNKILFNLKSFNYKTEKTVDKCRK